MRSSRRAELDSIAWTAFSRRLRRACFRRPASTGATTGRSGRSTRRRTPACSAWGRKKSQSSSRSSRRSRGCRSSWTRPANFRKSSRISRRRADSRARASTRRTTRPRVSSSSSMSRMSSRISCALSTRVLSGFLISWASPPVMERSSAAWSRAASRASRRLCRSRPDRARRRRSAAAAARLRHPA